MKKSRHALKDSDYELLYFLFPSYNWIHLEPKEFKLSTDEIIKQGGKYVVYGSKQRVEYLVEELGPRIGDVIEAMKYSTIPIKETPNALEDQHALIVYCNEKTRGEAMKTLESVGVEHFEWKSNIDSWREVLDDTWLCLNLYICNPDRFREVCRLVDKEKSFELIDGLNKIASELAPEFRKAATRLYKSSDVKPILEELRELVEQKFTSLL